MASGIHFSITTDRSKPGYQVLDDALIEIVKNIWGNRLVDINKWEVFPEWMLYWLDASFFACLCKLCRFLSYGIECLQNLPKFSGCSNTIRITKLITRCRTCWTLSIFDSNHKNLFHIITDEGGINGMAISHNTIPTHHLDPINASTLQWFKNVLHAHMTQVAESMMLCRLV